VSDLELVVFVSERMPPEMLHLKEPTKLSYWIYHLTVEAVVVTLWGTSCHLVLDGLENFVIIHNG
jgi:hypothetical protein